MIQKSLGVLCYPFVEVINVATVHPLAHTLNNQEAFPDQESVIELTLFDVDVRHDSGKKSGTGT